MFGKLKIFYRRHVRVFTATFTLLIVAAWLLGPTLFDVIDLSQSFLLSFAIISLALSSIQEYLDDLISPASLRVNRSQSENNQTLIRALASPKIDQVRMIEYDSESTKALIFFLLERGARVHCLLQHPDCAVNESQRRRTIFQIMTKNEEYAGYLDRIEFSYYRDSASVRGRKIDDNLISIGWYTYDRRPDIKGRQIWGHTNPVIVSDARSHEGRIFTHFFDLVFENLLSNSEPWEQLASDYELYIKRKDGKNVPKLLQFEAELAKVPAQYQVPAGTQISVLRKEELEAISAEELLPVLATSFDDRDWNAATVASRVLNKTTCTAAVVARTRDEGRLIGFVSVHSTSEKKMSKLHWLAVERGWRGQGIGDALSKSACAVACDAGFERIMLHTESFRVAAISIYLKLGFYEVPYE